jgi:hypothetical protein
MDEQKQFTGWLEDPIDNRDLKLEEVLGALKMPTFDWAKGYRVENEVGALPHLNQEQTLTCVSCSTAMYHKVLRKLNGEEDDFSVRDIYSQTFIAPDGGSYIRDACKLAATKGVATVQVFPIEPWTETHLRDRKDADSQDIKDALLHLANEYRVLEDATNIDNFALALQAYHGVISGVRSMGHCMYAKGAYLKNGKKTILFHNSWGEGSDIERSEDDFRAGDIVTPWCLLESKKKQMYSLYSADGKRVYAVYSGLDGIKRRKWVQDPTIKGRGDDDGSWAMDIKLDPSILNIPYAGAIIFTNPDDPR